MCGDRFNLRVLEVNAHDESCRTLRFISDGHDCSILSTDVETGSAIAHLENCHGVPMEEEIDNDGCGITLQLWQSNPKLVLRGFIDMMTIDEGNIVTVINISQELKVQNSGKLEMDYLRKILELSLTTLQKLLAPATKDELKVAHLSMLNWK
ncbi:uncharacterized protein LOC130780842 [Actinidia eriantha]|uniref:uncharacterized protein LOC130780842 n=1 Tax=Actinidia eriantha TaxID=165200 RepID=UPI002588EB36|nr:uncharacterized protein LOC130780842 [Actinidia eriantha]